MQKIYLKRKQKKKEKHKNQKYKQTRRRDVYNIYLLSSSEKSYIHFYVFSYININIIGHYTLFFYIVGISYEYFQNND